MTLAICSNCGDRALARHSCLAWQVVCTDLDGPHGRYETVYAHDAKTAAERWCAAYDRDRAGAPAVGLATVVSVRRAGDSTWEHFDIQIETVTRYHAISRMR